MAPMWPLDSRAAGTSPFFTSQSGRWNLGLALIQLTRQALADGEFV